MGIGIPIYFPLLSEEEGSKPNTILYTTKKTIKSYPGEKKKANNIHKNKIKLSPPRIMSMNKYILNVHIIGEW